MAIAQNSISSTSQTPSSIDGPPCHCMRPTVRLMAWTDANPGRRFYNCYIHEFFAWADTKEPHGWQKQSLLEAIYQIRRLRNDKKDLYSEIVELQHQLTLQAIRDPVRENEDDKSDGIDVRKFGCFEGDKMLRQMFLVSWGGFIAVTALLVYLLKK